MLKKVNKAISLVIAAAAVISLTPSSVSAASKEIKSKDGEIYNAIAYKDGNFYISGEPDKEDEAAYYLSNGEYDELDDIDSEDKVETYGTKYVEIEDGAYYLDLSNGKVTDDEVKDKELDNVSVSLRSEIKYDNDGRYDDTDAKNLKNITELPKSKFAEGWYAAQYEINSVSSNINGGASSFNVYTDKAGKYIDADYNLGKIKVKLSDGKSATIENTNDEKDYVRGQVSNTKVVGQDSNNIYRLATITVRSTNGAAITQVNGVTLSDATTSFSQSSDKTSVSFDVIQVISKSQSTRDINGIKYAKTVTNYVLSDKDGEKIDLLSDEENAFSVADGKLVNYKIDGNELEAAVVELKNKSSVYYIELGDSDDVTLQDEENSIDIDAEGNLWALTDEAILKFDNDENFDEVYETDEEYSNLSVYDEDNLVVWNSDEEIYSIISKVTDTEDEDEDTTNPDDTDTTPEPEPAQTGWVQTNGSWSYKNSDGSNFKGWLKSSGNWYYLDDNGIMATGWKYVDSKWYFLDSSGAMKTGWLSDSGAWYYLNSSGEMLKNTTINGYKLGKNGAWVK